MAGKPAVIAVAALLFVCCGKPKPAHSYVFESYTTTDDGATAYVFASDEMEGSIHVHYIATCEGHMGQSGADSDCRAVAPYLHKMLPPTYLSSPDDGEHEYLEIPSLNIEVAIVEAY